MKGDRGSTLNGTLIIASCSNWAFDEMEFEEYMSYNCYSGDYLEFATGGR